MQESGQKPQQINPNAPIFQMFADLAAKEAAKFEQREEQRRRRDPTYRPDALDFTDEPTRAFDEKADYYKILGVDQFASSSEIKKQYMRLSLKCHPDKQFGKSDAEVREAVESFKQLTEAYEILSDQPTRRQYDRARDKKSASKDHFGYDTSESDVKTPPTRVEVEVTLEQVSWSHAIPQHVNRTPWRELLAFCAID